METKYFPGKARGPELASPYLPGSDDLSSIALLGDILKSQTIR